MVILAQQFSVAHHFLAELRNIHVQKDRLRFRRNLERLGEIFAYEISKTLPCHTEIITTPLGTHESQKIATEIVLATVLRAGVPFHQGFLNYFDQAENAFIGAYRGEHQADESFEIVQGYVASPSLEGKILIVTDPMLATGKSIQKTLESLKPYGNPLKVYLAAVIASQQGVEHMQAYFPEVSLWIGDIDQTLNQKAYIVPGLGDAGDLAFGEKS